MGARRACDDNTAMPSDSPPPGCHRTTPNNSDQQHRPPTCAPPSASRSSAACSRTSPPRQTCTWATSTSMKATPSSGLPACILAQRPAAFRPSHNPAPVSIHSARRSSGPALRVHLRARPCPPRLSLARCPAQPASVCSQRAGERAFSDLARLDMVVATAAATAAAAAATAAAATAAAIFSPA